VTEKFRKAIAEFRNHRQNPRAPAVGTAVALDDGYWLWGGIEVKGQRPGDIWDFGNGTYLDLDTGEVRMWS
jgi:hypothetical protein